MDALSIAIITDHSTHTEQNSFYGLFRGCKVHPAVRTVSVISRNYECNKAFFNGDMDAKVYAFKPYVKTYQQWIWPKPEQLQRVALKEYDLILLRLPEPTPDLFFNKLEEQFSDSLFINKPSGILEVGSKAYLTNFPNLCPPLKIVTDSDQALELADQMDIVLKPLRNYGGKGLIKIENNQLYYGNQLKSTAKLNSIWDANRPMLAMKYLPNLHQGDKRTVVAHGEIQFSTVRYPPRDSWICNVAQGGHSELSSPAPEEIEIADILSQKLYPKGIILFGFDTLVDNNGKRKLSEINVQSIGGIVPAERDSNEPISENIIRQLLIFASQNMS